LTTIGDRVETANILPNDVEKPFQPVDPKKFYDNMHRWLSETSKVKPGNEMKIMVDGEMKDIPLEENEKQALIEYLAGLRLNK
jgi:hypothetical protein